ncbi:MAG: metallophosphoesterase [Verrucomicrobiales bacterium]|nr:metallophosphoesterase [Verrucomicrobiales bacterium]
MKRRALLQSLATHSTAVPLMFGISARGDENPATPRPLPVRGGFALDDHRVRFFSDAIRSPFKVMILADTHLFRDDARGEVHRVYSARMARAYNETRHFKTGEPTHPEAGLVEALRLAQEAKVALVALVGDIVSFPSLAAIERVGERLAEAGLPYVYVAGNHDCPPNLLGICAGHIHRPSLDVQHGVPQFVTDANAMGAYLMTEFLPAAG